MNNCLILFPHQLYFSDKLPSKHVVLIEEHLFFRQYEFHKLKLVFHRSSMKKYAAYLKEKGYHVEYIEAMSEKSDVRVLIDDLSKKGLEELHFYDPVDDWLEQRVKSSAKRNRLKLSGYSNPLFLNKRGELKEFFTDSSFYFQTSFYKQQRKSRKVLIGDDEKPIGGQWSFDKENRKKYPKGKKTPNVEEVKADEYWIEASKYVDDNFSAFPGDLEGFVYPTDRVQSKAWLSDFINKRFNEFGDYEDAIVADGSILNHSLLSPLINIGLLSIEDVLDESLSVQNKIKINSLEGFVRQIMGWREFIRGMYAYHGRKMRTTNFWGFERKIPKSFYDGSTGITPFDITIKKVLKHGYCHHIERLMILGNFMVLCEIDPDDVYQWFMELFIDAYDWVMVPNVYGMSQFADGGLFATKPYISGSNYIMKMSDHEKGEWQEVWDGLFWRFLHVNREFFLSNPRLSMLVRSMDRMNEDKLKLHLKNAEEFLAKLDSN